MSQVMRQPDSEVIEQGGRDCKQDGTAKAGEYGMVGRAEQRQQSFAHQNGERTLR